MILQFLLLIRIFIIHIRILPRVMRETFLFLMKYHTLSRDLLDIGWMDKKTTFQSGLQCEKKVVLIRFTVRKVSGSLEI